jgi:1,5-anhydro-D-fructose reductase (1,5-anhydro-D-mannitol-forming)
MSNNRTPKAGWLVVGTGRHVDRFGLPGLARARGAEAVALCGTDPVHTADLAARHGVGTWGSSIEVLLHDPRVTHVYVASRNDDHERHVALAAAAGRPVLCEKPLAGNSADAAGMLDTVTRHGVPLGTAFHLRHNAAHLAVKTLVESGTIGRLLQVEVSYFHAIRPEDDTSRLVTSRDVSTPSRGAMAGAGAHAVDLVQWLGGGAIVRLTANMAELETDGAAIERYIQVSGVNGAGVLVSIATGRLVRPANQLTVVGESGTLTVTGSIGQAGGGRVVLRSVAVDDAIDFDAQDVYAAQFEHFAQAVAARRTPDASGADGLSALRTAEAVDRALTNSAERHVVEFVDVPNQGAL